MSPHNFTNSSGALEFGSAIVSIMGLDRKHSSHSP